MCIIACCLLPVACCLIDFDLWPFFRSYGLYYHKAENVTSGDFGGKCGDIIRYFYCLSLPKQFGYLLAGSLDDGGVLYRHGQSNCGMTNLQFQLF